MADQNKDITFRDVPKSYGVSFEEAAAPASLDADDHKPVVVNSALSPKTKEKISSPVNSKAASDTEIPTMPSEKVITQNDSQSAAASSSVPVFTNPQGGEQVVVTEDEASKSSASLDIPSMPVGVAPDEEGSHSGHFSTLGNDETDYSKKDMLKGINDKLTRSSQGVVNWVKPRRNLLAKLAIVIVAILIMVFTVCKLSVVPIASITTQHFFEAMGLQGTSFNVVYADGNNIILSDVQTKDKKLAAKEITFTYTLSDLFFKNTIKEIVVKNAQANLEIGKGQDSGSFVDNILASKKHQLQGQSKSQPKYIIKVLKINNGNAIVSGKINGSATFSVSGMLNKQLQIKVPVSFNTDIIKGDVALTVTGWGSNFEVGIDIDNLNLDKSDNNKEILSIHDAKLKFVHGLFKQMDFTAKYTRDQYEADIISDIQYTNDKFKAEISLKSTVNNAAESAITQPKDQIVSFRAEEPTNLIESLPVGDIKISIKEASLDSRQGFRGNLPLEIVSNTFSWNDISMSNTKLDFSGHFSCADSVCKYTLNDASFISLDKISFPVMKFGFEAMEKMSLSLAQTQEPLFTFSPKSIRFNAELINPSIKGSLAEVKTSNIFLLKAQNLSAKGYVNTDGSYKADIDIENFNLSDVDYVLSDAYASFKISSDAMASLDLQASKFGHQSSSSWVIPSSITLESRPTTQDNVYKFKLLLQQKAFGTSQLLSGTYDYYKGRAVANFTIPEINFSSKMQPKHIFPFFGDYLTDVQGKVAVEGTINWNGVSFSGPARFTIKDFSAKKGYASFSGVESTFLVSNFNPITTAKPQDVKIEHMNLLMPFKNVSGKISISSSGFTVQDFTSSLAGGKVDALEPIKIPYELNASPYMLLLTNGDFKTLSEILRIPATMSGRFNARLPLLVRQSDALITFGDIASATAGSFKAVSAPNADVSEFAKVMSNLNYTKITGTLDASLNNDTSLTLSIDGSNPSIDGGKPFKKTGKMQSKTSKLLK